MTNYKEEDICKCCGNIKKSIWIELEEELEKQEEGYLIWRVIPKKD